MSRKAIIIFLLCCAYKLYLGRLSHWVSVDPRTSWISYKKIIIWLGSECDTINWGWLPEENEDWHGICWYICYLWHYQPQGTSFQASTVENSQDVITETFLINRLFFVEMVGRKGSRMDCVSPILFYVLLNDQTKALNTKSFVYTDDLCIATQSRPF